MGCGGGGGSSTSDDDTSGGTAVDTGTEGGTLEGTGSTDGGSSGSESGSSTGDLPEPLPPLDAAPLTTEQVIVPTHEVVEAEFDPRVPEQRDQLLADGFGDYTLAEGEPVLTVTPDGMDPPPPGPNAGLVTRFVHLADTQLADDESPLRVVSFDNPTVAGAFRPQETHGCRILNAAVRTINAVHTELPLDFVVLGGDNADAAQTNEVQWFLDILDGKPVVHCDSGDDDDIDPDDDQDPKDPFAPVGLDVPWIWVSGNHDILVQGNFVTESRKDYAIGSTIFPGGSTRDWTQYGGPMFMGPVVPDERRALVDNRTLLEMVAASGDGHGITQETIDLEKATYTWDVEGTPIRFLVVDTAAPTGAAEGLVVQSHVDEVIRPALDQAEADGKLVVVSSHHASHSLTDGGGLGGTAQPGALQPDDWRALLAEYPNVIMHLCGHSHVHAATWIEPAGTRGYWEVITSALIDWPHQLRVIELHDQDNGWWTIRAIAFDYATDGDPTAEDGRKLGILDFTSGWQSDGRGDLEDRNVELWIEVP